MSRTISFCRISFFASVIAILTLAPASADVQSVTLPDDFADFAMNPKSGDLVALDADKGQAFLFRTKDLEMERAEPAGKLRVGSTPVSVFFKEFDKKQIFAVVCSQDSHMYLINAADFTLLAKVELSQSGVSNVTGSRNSRDPFIYYNFGSGHGSQAGVVSLRDLKNKGLAFDDSIDCAITASGDVAYRRGPWSPSGFESLIRTNDLSDDKPTFARLFYDHNSTSQYIPDPFDRFTVAGSKVYTHSLEKNVAALNFTPMVFFDDRPVVVGVGTTGRGPASQLGLGPMTLRAASYNTFSDIGDQVSLRNTPAKDGGSLPRGLRGDGDFKRIRKRVRMFADGARDRVVLASRNELFFVPLEEFNLPDEPFLLAELKGADQVVVGKECKLTLVPRDEKVEVVFDDIPEGMKRDGMTITWTPELDAIGLVSLAVTLKHADIQRSMKFDVEVTYPSFKLPFPPTDLAINSAGTQAVIWQGPQLDRFGRPSTTVSSTVRIAVIDLASGEVKAERKLASSIGRGAIADKYVILWTPNSSPKCEILKIDDLERAKSLVAGGPIRQVDVAGGSLVVQTPNAVEVYSLSTFARLKSFTAGSSPTVYSSNRNNGASILSPHGLFLRNVLYDFELKPKLILTSNGLPSLAGADPRNSSSLLQMSNSNSARDASGRSISSSNGTARIATTQVPGANASVSLNQSRSQIQVPGSTHTWRTRVELSVSASGELSGQQILVRKNLYSQTASSQTTPMAVLTASQTKAVVADGSRLYQWALSSGGDGDDFVSTQLRLAPQQTSLTLGDTGKTVLKHQASGGKAPVKFSILSPYDGFSIDEKTGTLTVDNQAMLDETLSTLERFVVQSNRGESYVDTLRNKAVQMIEQAAQLLGRRPNGAPVAVPIRIDVTDADLASSSMQYYVVAEVPSVKIIDRLRKLDQEREKKMAEAKAAKLAAKPDNPEGAPPANASELARRVESLENRVDLLTRQLNILLKKLDTQQEK